MTTKNQSQTKKIRKYNVNLHFQNTDHPLYDSEYGDWSFKRYCTDFGKESPASQQFDFSNPGWGTTKGWTTMRVHKRGEFILNSTPFDYRKDKVYTIAFRFKVDLDTLVYHREKEERITGLEWDGCTVNILDYRLENREECISITMEEDRIEIPTDVIYGGNSYMAQLVITMDHGLLTIMLNGIRYSDRQMKHPLYIINNLRLGNLYEFSHLEDCIVDYDELILVNDAIYPPRRLLDPFHSVYPEEIVSDNEPNKDHDYSYSGPSRLDDMMRKLDITRHIDYKTTSIETHTSHHKFNFNSDDEDLEVLK